MVNNDFWIKKNQDFQKVYQKKQYLNNTYYSICYLNNKLKYPRFGLVVSSKRFNTAVLRNKVKRQLRPIIKNLGFEKAYDIVIIVRESYLKLKFNERLINLELLLKKLK